jgi:DHA1 family bicyclomycin/chloramphenicol resistance-like MFS transporter
MKRSREKLSKTLSLFKHVLSNRKYIFYVLQMAFAQAILFGYIAASPFIIQQHYGFSPFAFSLFFAINSVAIVSGAAIAVKFKRQETGIHTSCIGMLICGALILVALSKGASIILFETLMLILLFMIGITFTIVAALAMNSAKKYSGTASAVLGAAGFLFGNIVSPLVGLGNILVSTGIIFVVCAAFSIFFASLARYYDKIHVK